jgi:hypothetical protein
VLILKYYRYVLTNICGGLNMPILKARLRSGGMSAKSIL